MLPCCRTPAAHTLKHQQTASFVSDTALQNSTSKEDSSFRSTQQIITLINNDKNVSDSKLPKKEENFPRLDGNFDIDDETFDPKQQQQTFPTPDTKKDEDTKALRTNIDVRRNC